MSPPKVNPKGKTTLSEADSRNFRPPSLAICINEHDVGPDRSKDGTATFDGDATNSHLKKVLEGICKQLTDDATWAKVWETPAGALPIPPSGAAEELEEAWAKGIDELTFGTAYTGPDIIPAFPPKGSVKSPIRYVYSRFSLDPEGTGDWTVPGDPAISLGMACQHMTTYGLLARGVSAAETSGVGVAASQSTAGLPLFAKRSGSWHAQQGIPIQGQKDPLAVTIVAAGDAHAASYVAALPEFGPGAVYTYNPLGHMRSMLTIVDEADCITKDGKPLIDGDNNRVVLPGKAIQMTMQAQQDQQDLQKQAPGVALDTKGRLDNADKEAAAAKASGAALPPGKVIAKMSLAAQLDGSHASMILRVYKTKAFTPAGDGAKPKDAEQRVQLLDSGARMSCPELSADDITHDYAIVMPHMGDGHLCGEGYTFFPGSTENFVGFGTVPKIEHGDEMKGMLKNARQVGVARLAISAETKDPGEDDVLFLSKCIPMWTPTGDFKRFSIARLAWSLRNTAYAPRLRAYWIVYSPRGYLAEVMWEPKARTMSLADMMKEAISRHNAAQTDPKKQRTALSVGNDLLSIAVLSTNPDRKALQIWRGHCLHASGNGQPPRAIRTLFVNTTQPDMTLFKEMEKKFKDDWEAERHRLQEKADHAKQLVNDDVTTYTKSKDPQDLEVLRLKQRHQLAGDYDWFDGQHDRSTLDADLAADKAAGFTGKPPKTPIDPPSLTAYREWAATPFAEGHAHPLQVARDKLDGEYCRLGTGSDGPIAPELLK